jgi:hypothetical protein
MKKMKGGDTCLQKRNVLQMGWKDKRVVFMSTYDDTSMGKIVTIQKGASRKKFKPQCVYSTIQRVWVV